MRDIAEHIAEALGAGHDVVLVTVVGSKGSTPACWIVSSS